MPYRISRLGHVEVQSIDLDRDLDYYLNVIGLHQTGREGNTLTSPIRHFSEHSRAFPADLRLCTKSPSFPQSLMQDGILHQKSSYDFYYKNLPFSFMRDMSTVSDISLVSP